MQFILGVHCMQQFSLSVKYTNEAAEPGWQLLQPVRCLNQCE